MSVLLQRLDQTLPVPVVAHHGDAGVDLYAAAEVWLGPGERALVPTGIAIALPTGYAAFVHPRSGLATRHGVTVLNAPGTIDAGYRGEIQVNLHNADRHAAFTVRHGDRIAQLVIQAVCSPTFTEVTDLPHSARGAGGHGSSGGFAAAGRTAYPQDDGLTPTGSAPEPSKD